LADTRFQAAGHPSAAWHHLQSAHRFAASGRRPRRHSPSDGSGML